MINVAADSREMALAAVGERYPDLNTLHCNPLITNMWFCK